MRPLKQYLPCLALTLLVTSVGEPCRAQDAADVANVIVPFVEKHCVSCHGEKEPKGDLSLHRFKDDESILKDHTLWLTVVEKVRAGEMPPKRKPRPSPQELEQFEKAAKGVFERFARSGRRNPGRVVMRRLSKYEYQCTIRDLLGVTIPLGDTFPGDNVSQGFDNLADALAISPVHMDGYLAAAETILKAAIVVGEPPPPPKQSRGGTHGLQPGVARGRDNNGRLMTSPDGQPLDAKSRVPALPGDGWRLHCEKGPLEANLQDLVDPGDYKVVARLQGYKVGKEAPKFALLVNGKEVFQGVGSDMAEEHVVPLQLNPGKMRIGVSLLTEDADPTDPRNKSGIIVYHLALIGPMMPVMHAALLAAPKELEGDAKSRHVIERFASRAYRRPAAKAEVDRLMEIVKRAEQVGQYRLREEDWKKLSTSKAVPEDVLKDVRSLTRDSKRFVERSVFVARLTEFLGPERTQAHLDTILKTADTAKRPWEAAIALAMRAAICSPHFLFRVEPETPAEGTGPQPIDDYALASRLSYFLWSSMPDDELFALAAKRQLHQNLPTQVQRMLADPRSKALVENFATQWLNLQALSAFDPDPKVFPEFKAVGTNSSKKWPLLRDAMLTETQLFLHALMSENRSILEIVDSDYTFLNRQLGQHYNIRDTNGNPYRDSAGREITKPDNPGDPLPEYPFVRVRLTGASRGGLLTQASVLSLTSTPSRTSLVRRGAWILDRILGTPPPPPPPNVPPLEAGTKEDPKAGLKSLRQQVELHRARADCATCHARIDPIGFAFEHFDAIGRYRDAIGKEPIDVQAELPNGRKFNGVKELKNILLEQKRGFARSLSEKTMTYAIGRKLEYYDILAMDEVLAKVEKGDYRFHTLVTAIVESDPFRMRQN